MGILHSGFQNYCDDSMMQNDFATNCSSLNHGFLLKFSDLGVQKSLFHSKKLSTKQVAKAIFGELKMYRDYGMNDISQEDLDWPEIPTESHVGTGSGMHLDGKELKRTGQVVTGYELLEVCSNMINHKEFQLRVWVESLQGELENGSIIMVERPTLENQYGKFRYDPNHEYNIYGGPPGTATWAEDVNAGRDPGHGWRGDWHTGEVDEDGVMAWFWSDFQIPLLCRLQQRSCQSVSLAETPISNSS
jgi:hypothetical protein